MPTISSGAPKGSLISDSGLTLAALIGGREPSTNNISVVSTHKQVPTNLVSGRMLHPSTELVVTYFSVPSDFLVGRPG